MNPWFGKFDKYMLTQEEILKKACDNIIQGRDTDPNYIETNFSELVVNCENEAYNIFKENQNKAWKLGTADYLLMKHISPNGNIIEYLQNNFDELNSFFLSLSQSRKARAGDSFQYILEKLFRKLPYPFEEEPVVNGQPDFLFPNKEFFFKSSSDCLILTAKRLVRERWREVVIEGAAGSNFFLATIDDQVSDRAIKEMSGARVFLVVPKSLKETKKNYSNNINVISYETFIARFLKPKYQRWQDLGIV